MLTRWTNFVNRNFDLDKQLSNTGGLIVLLIVVVTLVILIFLCASEPEPEL